MLDNFDAVDADSSGRIAEDKGGKRYRKFILSLEAPAINKSRKKYRPRNQSYMDKTRGKIAGVTNTLGGAPAPQKASKIKTVSRPIALNAPAIETSTAVEKNDWHLKAPKGVEIQKSSLRQ